MTAGFLSLGEVVDVLESAWSGFGLESHKEVVPILGDSSSMQNSVLQESAQGYRTGSLTLVGLSDAEKDALRGYDETSETVTFIDYDESSRDVRVLAYSGVLQDSGAWQVDLVLQELSGPTPAGS